MGVLELIGQTPLVRLDSLSHESGADVLAKLERGNPGGSVKDRTARALVEDAERRGRIRPGDLLVEATSGNTGIALAMIAAARGYRLVLVMPEGQSAERKQLFYAYGAQLVESPKELRTQGAVDLAKEIEASIPGAYMTRQHENSANPAVHETTTGPEIWTATDGQVAAVVAGVGTGGTITGVGRYLKRQDPSIQMVAVEPENSAVISGKPPGRHNIQGIGAGFIPKVLDIGVVDAVIPVSDEDAWNATRWLARNEGLLVGISSGAAYRAAQALVSTGKFAGKTVVVMFPDGGDRYLSTGIYEPTPPFDSRAM